LVGAEQETSAVEALHRATTPHQTDAKEAGAKKGE
jgi:hypothetical protein